MDQFDYWRLCDELSVIQAALLIVGEGAESADYVDEWHPNQQPDGYAAARTALVNAILSGRLAATIRYAARERGWVELPRTPKDIFGPRHEPEPVNEGEEVTSSLAGLASDLQRLAPVQVIYATEPDWHLTTIFVDDLRAWLSSRGFRGGFFFPDATDAPDFLDPSHPRYAPKLAAAVRAWIATGDARLVQGKHPKQALTKWLREHAAEFGLTDDEGKQNETGIEEAAKIANWQLTGGAPRTPTANPPIHPHDFEEISSEEDGPIPF